MATTGSNLTENITQTHYGLSVKTLEEAESTRQQVISTLSKVNELSLDVGRVRQQIDEVCIAVFSVCDYFSLLHFLGKAY